MSVTLDIKKWGNSLGIRLPTAIVKEAHLTLDQRVRLHVENGEVIISANLPESLSLEQRLMQFNPQRHGGEVLPVSQVLGAEKW